MKRVACAFLMALTLVACGTPAASNTGAAATPAPAGTPIVAGSTEEKARQALAKQLGVAADDLQLIGKEANDWRDASLGCPDPAAMYAMVITPGFKYTFGDGTKTYAVHTNQEGSISVLCDSGKPISLGAVAQ